MRQIPSIESIHRHLIHETKLDPIDEVLSQNLSGAIYLFYLHTERLKKNLLPTSASHEALEGWAQVFGVPRKKATATKVTASVASQKETTIKSGTPLKSASGEVFTVEKDFFLSRPGTSEITLLSEKKGPSTVKKGETFAFQSPEKYITEKLTVSEVIPGLPEESDEELKQRLLFRIKNPPCGGNKQDYIAWMRECPGLSFKGVWVYSAGERTRGTVEILATGNENGKHRDLTTEEIKKTLEFLDEKKPLCATVRLESPPRIPLEFSSFLVHPAEKTEEAIASIRSFLEENHTPGTPIFKSQLLAKAHAVAGVVSVSFEIEAGEHGEINPVSRGLFYVP